MHTSSESGPRPQSHVTLVDRVKTLPEICDHMLMLPAEVKSLKARVYKLETIIHFNCTLIMKFCLT